MMRASMKGNGHMTTLYHFGDPCVHCSIPHDEVPAGPCQGDPAKAVPIAYRSMGVRADGIERFLIRFSDDHVEQRDFPISQQAPYWHFGYSDLRRKPPRLDEQMTVRERNATVRRGNVRKVSSEQLTG
jgi:hypothetical protein